MSNSKPIQQAMFKELQEKSIFELAQTYSFEYLDEVLDRNIYPSEEALAGLVHFEEEMPDTSTPAAEVLAQLQQHGAPATVAQLGGRYFGFVNGSAVPAGLAAKQMATFWDQNTAMQVISPIAAKLESVVEQWFRQIFNLPEHTAAGFVSGTSTANLCALGAARYRLLKRMDWDVNEKGLFGAPAIRLVMGDQAHSSVIKAIALLGFGKDNIEWVKTDEQGRIIPNATPPLDEHTILVLQAGNVNSGSFDPFAALCEQANKANAWVHVDGAFGLWAGAVSSLKHLTAGMEKATSWAVDGHKTLNTPYDSGIVLCNDREAITSALHMSASYLVAGQDRDGMFFTPEMSRRARVIELWATLKYLGKDGIDQMILNMHERALQMADLLTKTEGYEVLNEVVFNQVVVCCETDELTTQCMQKIHDLRTCWVGGSVWRGRKVIRISICSWATTAADVVAAVGSFAVAMGGVVGLMGCRSGSRR